jgi:hypothetical protein
MASKLTKVVANFETSLATKLANGATSGALTSILDKNGINLVNGKYCMILDRGTGDEEHLIFDLSGTAISKYLKYLKPGSSNSRSAEFKWSSSRCKMLSH